MAGTSLIPTLTNNTTNNTTVNNKTVNNSITEIENANNSSAQTNTQQSSSSRSQSKNSKSKSNTDSGDKIYTDTFTVSANEKGQNEGMEPGTYRATYSAKQGPISVEKIS
ncbi:MAG: hypothetical protein E7Z84_05665 [Methanosphaera stadtmanae]|nr:hypothetical protein [Methanosphaera stadtmanae]